MKLFMANHSKFFEMTVDEYITWQFRQGSGFYTTLEGAKKHNPHNDNYIMIDLMPSVVDGEGYLVEE